VGDGVREQRDRLALAAALGLEEGVGSVRAIAELLYEPLLAHPSAPPHPGEAPGAFPDLRELCLQGSHFRISTDELHRGKATKLDTT